MNKFETIQNRRKMGRFRGENSVLTGASHKNTLLCILQSGVFPCDLIQFPSGQLGGNGAIGQGGDNLSNLLGANISGGEIPGTEVRQSSPATI